MRKSNRSLARDNVNELRFGELEAAMQATIEDKPLKGWAAYRLQKTYGHEVDPKQVPTAPLAAADELSIALEGEKLLAAEQGEPARQLLEKTWRKQKAKAPAVGLVLARLYIDRDMTKKAEAVLSSILKVHPAMIDARLELSGLVMASNRPGKALPYMANLKRILLLTISFFASNRFWKRSDFRRPRNRRRPGEGDANPVQSSFQTTQSAVSAYQGLLQGKPDAVRATFGVKCVRF